MSVLASSLQPPPTAEELALKEQVAQALASQGVLAKLRAELRAAVFQVMHEREGVGGAVAVASGVGPKAPKLSEFSVDAGAVTLALVVDCLEFFGWSHALRVLRSEAGVEQDKDDLSSSDLGEKLGLAGPGGTRKPVLLELVETRLRGEHAADESCGTQKTSPGLEDDGHGREKDSAREESKAGEDVHDQGEKEDSGEEEDVAVWTTGSRKSEEDADAEEAEAPATFSTEKAVEQAKSEDGEDSDLMEESMAEEIPSDSELDESIVQQEDEEDDARDRSKGEDEADHAATASHPPPARGESEDEDEGDDAVSLAAPPPAPAKLPSLGSAAGTRDDEFDAELEAERLSSLDAKLRAMEDEDDTGTLQQLKASLQMELQQSDSLASSGVQGGVKDEDEDPVEPNARQEQEERGSEEEEEEGYGSSDFEEEEEIASEISEEVESMAELSKDEDKDEDEAVETDAVQAEQEDEGDSDAQPPRVLQSDTRVDNEDALNSYDYVEAVEKGGW